MIFEIVAGKNEKKEITVDESVCFIGSDSSCQILIKHSSISGKHVKVEQEGSNLFVTDISDSNTVIINKYKLDHKKKTLYLGHYPIQVGPGIFITIRPGEIIDDTESIKPKNSLSSFERTGLKTRKNNVESLEQGTKNKTNQKNNSIFNKQTALIFLGMIGFSFWYLQEQAELNEDLPESTELAPKNKSTKIILPKRDLSELSKERLCESPEEKSLCSAIFQSIETNEGIKITEEGVFIFLKLDQHLNKNDENKLFASYSEDKKLKYTLANLILQYPKLNVISVNQKIHAIGFDTYADIPKLRAYLRIDRTPDFQFSDEELKTIHSYSINAAIPKFFEDYLSPYISFKKL